MKFFYLLLTCISGSLILFISANFCNDKILIRQNASYTSCDNYFKISSQLEEKRRYKKLLCKYIYKSLVDVFDCSLQQTELDSLYRRDSFIETIFLFYNNDKYASLSHYENENRWIESYDRLLVNCNDEIVLHGIADSLLTYNKSNGIRVLWGDLKLNELHNFNSYIDYISTNKLKYKLSEVIVILHNIREYDKRDQCFRKLKSFDNSTLVHEKLEQLLENSLFVDYELFIEEIFGGY